MFDSANLAVKIIERAKSQGVSQAFIAEHLGVNRSFLNQATKGQAQITPDRLEKIAELLHTTPAYLMDETDDPAPIKKEPTIYGELSEDKQALIDLIVSIDDAQTIHAIKLLLDEIQSKK